MATLIDLQTMAFARTNKETGEQEIHYGLSFSLDSVTFNIAPEDIKNIHLERNGSAGFNYFSYKDARATLRELDFNRLQDQMLKTLNTEKQAWA